MKRGGGNVRGLVVGQPIGAAQAQARQLGLPNTRFLAVDAAQLDEPACYDLICTFDAIHDQADPARVLSNIRHALRPGGTYLMQDIRASSAADRTCTCYNSGEFHII